MTEYVGDFETTRDIDEYGAISMRVWLFDLCSIGDYWHKTFIDIQGGMEWLSGQDEITVYFHNLKFDGTYIVDWLFRNGYIWAGRPSAPGEFSFLISDMGQWFAGSVLWKNGNKTNFRDSLKKIPLPVRRIGSTYGLEMSKGEIDYAAPRAPGYTPTQEELSYVQRDTEIVARALKFHFDAGMRKMTMPSDAFEGITKTVRNYYLTLGIKYFREHPEVEAFCRDAYCGGISYVNPEIQEMEVGAGVVYDVNSLYPFVMRNYPYPVSWPIQLQSHMDLDSCLWIARFYIKAEHIPGKLPTLRANHCWIDTYYEGEVTLTKIDFEMLLENYIVEWEFISGYKWRHSDPKLFDEFISYWGNKKEHDTGGARQIDKLMMNSGYGKFGINPNRRKKRAELSLTENRVIFRNDDWEYADCNNVAIAAFVTAYARRELMRGVNASVGFCYCDTDSVHLATINGKSPAFAGNVDPVKLGAWKKESTFLRAKYLRQKTYIEEEEPGKFEVKACGMPDNCKQLVTWDNFRVGAKFPGKLVPIIRPGGADLVEREFTIVEPEIKF